MLRELLWSVVYEGTGRAAALPVQSFGKTGTSQDNRDAVFIGFAGDLVTGVWIGNDDNSPLKGVQGGGMPARIWRDFMAAAVRQQPGRVAAPIAVPRRAAPVPVETGPTEGGGYEGGPTLSLPIEGTGYEVGVDFDREQVTIAPEPPPPGPAEEEGPPRRDDIPTIAPPPPAPVEEAFDEPEEG
jgi:penicillin-binding protein 1A